MVLDVALQLSENRYCAYVGLLFILEERIMEELNLYVSLIAWVLGIVGTVRWYLNNQKISKINVKINQYNIDKSWVENNNIKDNKWIVTSNQSWWFNSMS